VHKNQLVLANGRAPLGALLAPQALARAARNLDQLALVQRLQVLGGRRQPRCLQPAGAELATGAHAVAPADATQPRRICNRLDGKLWFKIENLIFKSRENAKIYNKKHSLNINFE